MIPKVASSLPDQAVLLPHCMKCLREGDKGDLLQPNANDEVEAQPRV